MKAITVKTTFRAYGEIDKDVPYLNTETCLYISMTGPTSWRIIPSVSKRRLVKLKLELKE